MAEVIDYGIDRETATDEELHEAYKSYWDNWHNLNITRYQLWYRDWETDRKSTRLNSSHRL